MSKNIADALTTRKGDNIADGLQRIGIGLEKIADAINTHSAITAVGTGVTIRKPEQTPPPQKPCKPDATS